MQSYDGKAVIDASGQDVGTVERTYDDQSGKAQLIEVSIGHLLAKRHRLVPVDGASETDQRLQVSYQKQTIEDSPDASAVADTLDASLFDQIRDYYLVQQTQQPIATGAHPVGIDTVATMKEKQSMNTTTIAPNQLTNYDLVDSQGNKVGSIDGVWTDPSNDNLAFLGVRTIPLVGKTYVVPADQAQINSNNQTVTVPFTDDTIKNAPTGDPGQPISLSAVDSIKSYYQQAQAQQGTSSASAGAVPVNGGPNATNGPAGTAAYPVDNLTYDLYSLISEKLRGMESYAEYIKDAGGDQTITGLLRQMSQQDAQNVQQLQQTLVQRLTSRQSN